MTRPDGYRLPSRYVSRERRDEPVRRAPLLWIWTCDACGQQLHGEPDAP